MARIAPVQAWIAHSAWLPEFDLYERYNETPYEADSDIDWFRSGLNGMLTSRGAHDACAFSHRGCGSARSLRVR